MAITKISLENFKSYEKLDLELGNFNVLVGANASGKSNFTQVFKFLRSIEEEGLTDAISQNWGIDALRNLNIGKQRDMSFLISSNKNLEFSGEDIRWNIENQDYSFILRDSEDTMGIIIAKDEFIQKLKLSIIKRNEKGVIVEQKEISEGELKFTSIDGNVELEIKPSEFKAAMKKFNILPDPEDFPALFKDVSNDNLMIHRFINILLSSNNFFGIGVYDINPFLAKGNIELSGKSRLEEDGRNLPVILNKILKDEDSKRKLMNLLQSLLPFVSGVDTESVTERSLMMSLQENYYQDKSLKAHMLSDGTINVVALLVALYFEDNDVVIIEEPERNIHPRLISRVVEMMKDAARTKQIIITTHSPEIVKHAGLDNLLLVSRNDEGFSTISKPGEKEGVRQFLSDELGLDDLFIQDLLSV
jgi:predicted ATPase